MVDIRAITHPEEFIREKVRDCTGLEEIGELLGHLLSSNLSVWHDGSLTHIRARVATVSGLQVQVFPLNHNPPHFHVRGPDVDAKFSLDDCALFVGRIDPRKQELIRWFFENGGRAKLHEGWSRMHP